MLMQDAYKEMMKYVREGEICGCPYFVKVDGTYLFKMFTFFAMGDDEVTVYGLGQTITFDGTTVTCHEEGLFESEDKLIHIKDIKMIPIEERTSLYNEYYSAINDYVADASIGLETVKNTFLQIVSKDTLKLYMKVCPEFVKGILRLEEM